jgi:lipopolysaccharide export system ATP-binding protein
MSNDRNRPPGPPGRPPFPPAPPEAGRPAAAPPPRPAAQPPRPPLDPRQTGAGQPPRAPAEPRQPQQAQRPTQPPPARAQAHAPAQQAAGYEGPRLVTHNRGLVAKNLGKRFKKRPVVRGVSLTLQRGEVVGLLGPNGAGKTTCFYMITGLMPPDYGSIVLDGADITDLPMYRRARLGIGYLPQEASIFRGLSVANNIRAVLEVTESNRDRREAILDALLAEFSITHLRHTPALALSGGERRRVEIARSLASNPHFVLLDEPFAGIDPIAVGDIRDLVAHLKDRGIGVLITDHNVRETLDVIDRAYIIHDGMMLMEGAPSDIVGNEDVRRVYLGDRFNL